MVARRARCLGHSKQLASEAFSETYEAYVRDWADPGSLSSSPFFQRLKSLGITFIDDAVGPLELPEDRDTFDPAHFDVADLGWIEALYESNERSVFKAGEGRLAPWLGDPVS